MYLIENSSLMQEWDYEKNSKVDPCNLTCKSNQRVWWRCKSGHSWQMSVSHRTAGSGCPYCSNRKVWPGYNDLKTVHPEIAAEWNYARNMSMTPEMFVSGSGKKFWWKCKKCGHEWEASIYDRTKGGTGCPECGKQKRVDSFYKTKMAGRKSIADTDLLEEWDYEKNGNLDPHQLPLRSNKRVWWKCEKGHQWQTTPDKRISGNGCPYCSNHKVWPGYNDVETMAPDVLKDWDCSKNGRKDPCKILYTSYQRVWWKCSNCGHEWETTIRDRALLHHGCTQCASTQRSKKRIETFIKKNGSLADTKLISEWNYDRNGDLCPEKFTPKSNQKVWWKCSVCGYEWEAKINNRANGRGCPCCSNRVVVPGVNDLKTTHPDLAAEWDSDKNMDLTPAMVTAGSGKRIWWLCPKGHSYQATILHRSSGTNCPICNSGRQTSFAEQAIFFYVKQIYPDAINRCRAVLGNRMELDIYVPSIHVGIEYDGSFWHREDKEPREAEKYRLCKEKNITLIRIKEKINDHEQISADHVYSTSNMENHKQLAQVIQFLIDKLDPESNMWTRKNFNHIHSDVIVDLNRDNNQIRKYMTELHGDSIADLYPQIAAEWHPTKNENLKPEMFKPNSGVRVWWQCRVCGHEWQAVIGHRARGNTGCPACYEQNRSKNHPGKKKIYQYTRDGVFIKEWESITEAGQALSINGSNIGMCAKHQRNVAGGYRWEYLKINDDVEQQLSLF